MQYPAVYKVRKANPGRPKKQLTTHHQHSNKQSRVRI